MLSARQLIEFSTIAICIAPVKDDERRRAARSHRAMVVVIQVDSGTTHAHTYTDV